MRRPLRALLLIATGLAPISACNCEDQLAQLKPSVVVEPDSLDFGKVPIDITKSLPLKLKNIGSYKLDVTGYSVDPPFIAPTRTGTSIDTGASIQVSVGFRPRELGMKSAQLSIMTSDKKVPVVKVPLTGIGIQAAIKVEPAMVDFGDVVFRAVTPMMQREVKVSNPGTDSFMLTAIELVENGGGAFGLDPMMAQTTYMPGDSHTFVVTFLPRMMGPVMGSIRLTDTTADAPMIDVPLSGKAVGPVMQICTSVGAMPEQCTPSVAMPKLGFVTDPNLRVDGRIRVKNTGDRDLNVSEVSAPPGIRGFIFNPMIPSMNPFVVRPGQESVFQVTFAPTDYLYQNFVAAFPSDSALQMGSMVQVEGRTRQPAIQVIPELATINLGGTINHGESEVKILNCGTMALTLSSVVLRQPSGPLGIRNAPMAGTMIPPQNCPNDQAMASFVVTFDQAAPGMFTGAVDVASNDPSRRNVVVSIRANKTP